MFPAEMLYPPYLADPRSPEFAVAVVAVPEPGVPESGEQRFQLELGGRFGLLRLTPAKRPALALQLDIEAGFLGQFDIDHSLDNLGWDGTYALLAALRPTDRLALQVGTKHISSHVGDEYAERTGRRRRDWTREEATLGVRWQTAPGWELYAEGGWDFGPEKAIGQRPARVEAGVEHERPRSVGSGGRVGWYAAADVALWEEHAWQPDATLQLGLLVPSGERRWRVGLELRDGMVPIGELSNHRETSLAAALRLGV